MNQRIRYRTRVVIAWLIPTVLLIAVVALQTILGHFGGRNSDAWNWVCTTALPMCGIVFALAIPTNDISWRKFLLALGASIAYWIMVWATILLSPFAPVNIADLMIISNFWLSPMQCIVGACLGFAFSPQENNP
jgi:hypothetical protein